MAPANAKKKPAKEKVKTKPEKSEKADVKKQTVK